MKSEAISPRERCNIIHRLGESLRWEGTRLGAHVVLLRYVLSDGASIIQFSVRIGSHGLSASAKTVAEAVDQINQFVQARRTTRELPTAELVASLFDRQ